MSLNGGYSMIKYNSTQEELQIAYRSKKPALFYDENQRAHWAVIEETATQSVDEETQEPITLYEYSYRLLDEESDGSEVHLYRHVIQISGTVRGSVLIENDTNTPFTFSTLVEFLVAGDFITFRKLYPFAAIGGSGTNKFYSIGLYTVSGSSAIWSINTFGGNTIDITHIDEDKVTKIF